MVGKIGHVIISAVCWKCGALSLHCLDILSGHLWEVKVVRVDVCIHRPVHEKQLVVITSIFGEDCQLGRVRND